MEKFGCLNDYLISVMIRYRIFEIKLYVLCSPKMEPCTCNGITEDDFQINSWNYTCLTNNNQYFFETEIVKSYD